MYIPKHFEGGEADGRDIMTAHSWALLTTADEAGAPLCTHLAMQWEDDGSPHGALVGHMARANDHWKLFARPAQSLAIFWGPHAYVSPTWYEPGPKVPTWNYVTVHAYGRPQIVEATPAVLMVLTKLAAQYEGTGPDAWGLGRLPPGNAAGQTQNIVAFRMPLDRIETKLKLSQNREMEDRQRVIAMLEASENQDSQATARWMKRGCCLSERGGNLLTLTALALAVGAATGVVCALFRMALEEADRLRDLVIFWAHGQALVGFMLVVMAGAAAALAAWLVRRFAPHATGSGIPHVEAVLRQEVPPASFVLLPVKFVGGLLAIGSGLALGREGPSVQMGASVAHLAATLSQRCWADTRVLMAAGAGAGLATAFNAPIAGAVFVLEELVQRFERRIAIAALAASATAIATARAILGNELDFNVIALDHVPSLSLPLFFVLGAVAGLLAIGYNRSLLATMAAFERMRLLPPEARAALVGAAVAAVAWFAPSFVGGGDALTQRALSGIEPLAFLPLLFLLRLVMGHASYAAGTPGGLFAPLLVLGAQSGLLFGAACLFVFPTLGVPVQTFAVVGMAAFFTGVVRAPLTGIVLITEMTGAFTVLLPMLAACCPAMLVPTVLRNAPIYESLREGTLRRERALRKG